MVLAVFVKCSVDEGKGLYEGIGRWWGQRRGGELAPQPSLDVVKLGGCI